MASVLQKADYKVGCYTSPHYLDFRERIKINGKFISKKKVVKFVKKNRVIIREIQPSFFEITVAMAFDYFAKKKVDIAIIETGLGGRLDSTNIVTPILSIITNIGYDHQQFLGDTLQEIATEKAGIIKENIPVLIGEKQEDVYAVFEEKAKEKEAVLYTAKDVCLLSDYNLTLEGSSFKINGTKYKTDISGSYQEKNLLTAIAGLYLIKKQLSWGENNLKKGLKKVSNNTYFIGRWMKLGTKPIVFADSAHNEAGIQEVISNLQQLSYEKLHIVYGTVNDKDLSKILPLFPKNAQYFWCKATIPRGLDAKKLQEQAIDFDLKGEAYSSVSNAFNSAIQKAQPNDLILIIGSIFVVAEVLN